MDDFDIPVVPAAPSKGKLQDTFAYDVGFNFAFVGVGQGGSRIAEAFHKIGYARVAAINTAEQDLTDIDIPVENKLNIGGGGAGKDPELGERTIANKGEDVYDTLLRSWGEDTDYAFVCVGAGGGTGAGCAAKVVQVAKALLAPQGRDGRVGVIMALPKASEGQKPAKNTLRTIETLNKIKGISPIILLDNDRIRSLFDPSPAQEYPTSNNSVSKYLHLFNRLAAQDSEHTAFDRADFAKLLDSGLVAFGAQRIEKWGSPADISTAVRNQLCSTVLAPVDLSTGTVAGLLFVCGQSVYENIKSSTLDHGFESLTRIMSNDSTVFRGVYPTNGDALTAMCMIGGLAWPEDRLAELKKIAKI